MPRHVYVCISIILTFLTKYSMYLVILTWFDVGRLTMSVTDEVTTPSEVIAGITEVASTGECDGMEDGVGSTEVGTNEEVVTTDVIDMIPLVSSTTEDM